ncbi:MAG: response regulator transcription factor [Lachnospiraceae bacterium]|nr:response regulator transcription factor [Lachnospiraceae bacterium]
MICRKGAEKGREEGAGEKNDTYGESGQNIAKQHYEEKLSDEQKAASVPDLSVLTKRERQIAELIKRGLTNREIGEELFISETTVKKHVSNIFEKLGIGSRRDLK